MENVWFICRIKAGLVAFVSSYVCAEDYSMGILLMKTTCVFLKHFEIGYILSGINANLTVNVGEICFQKSA